MALDLQKIKKNYAGFEDFKIEHLAKNEARGLEPEVIPILVEEIKKRGLDSDLIKGIEAQTKELTESDFTELKSKIENLPCPDCGETHSLLMGSLIRSVKSFVILTFYKKAPVITCKTCGIRRRKNAMISTFLFGWWGIPFGIFRTPITLIQMLTDKNKLNEISDAIITSFVIENIGEIKTNWDKENELADFIAYYNNKN